MKMTRRNFLSASALALLSCPLAPTASAAKSDSLLAGLFHSEDTALPLKPLTAKGVDANPFMGSSESNIHHDCYNTDSTDAVLPVGICPEVNVAMEKTYGPSAFSPPQSMTAAATSSKAPIPSWTGATSSSAPPATTTS